MEIGGFIDTVTLPVSGTYRILVDPVTWSTGDLDVRLRFITDFTGSLTLGTPASIPLVEGQNAALTFTTTAELPISIQASGIQGHIVLACDVNMTVVNTATQAVVLGPTCIEGNVTVGPTVLPAGTYRIDVNPVSTSNGTLVLTVYDATEPTGAVTINGADLTFSGTDTRRNVNPTGSVTGSFTVTVISP
jgi:hypothetical protein